MSDLQLIMDRDAGGQLRLWACRGVGRGCPRNRYRASKKHCEDCILANEHETIGELQARLDRGDA